MIIADRNSWLTEVIIADNLV